ncbi:PREDICTED: aminopeptidase N-like isoform X2 [Polistes dominula]|uniref:Aminopeptidase N-like isoform X2 n=1 Tax=Polistes dominula TaxID=743375 RepID=A0ABM1J1M4_POLDO|nr:PREDICTED: aminopeptidase N-like isoform X2 [Polistes dominula]
MRRGSVSTWENFGRRNSANMAQFTGEPAQFMTTDEIKYRPTDGWFLSYKKATTLTILVIFGLIVSGLIGWYIHSIPTKRIHEEMNLINDESLEETKPISPNVRPLKYWLNFKPMIMDNNNQSNVTLPGRVIIEFRIYNDTGNINKLSLNAVNINVTGYQLLISKDILLKDYQKRYKRTNDSNVIIDKDYLTSDNDTMIDDSSTIIGYNESNKTILSFENDSNITLKNGTYIMEEETVKVDSTNGTLLVDYKVSRIKDPDWFSMNDIGRYDEIVEIKEYEIDHVNKVHVIHPKINLKSGVYFLTIDFEANPPMDVFYNVESSMNDEKTSMMGTLLKTAGSCSHLFPLFDELYLKAVFSLTVERPKEMKVLSNMPLRSTKDDFHSDNWLIDTFDDTPLITPNNLAFVMGNLKIVEQVLVNSTLLVTFWAEFNTTSTGFYMLDKFEPIIIGLTDILTVPYWLPKLDLICLPWKIVESSGNPGLISMKKSLFYTNDQSPLVTKTKALKTLISLLGEQWLGGMVNVKSWTNEWLLKGSLLYFQHLLIDKIDSSLEFAHSFVADIETKAMEFDGYSSSRPFTITINPPRMISMNERNMRGACLIRMLHGAINNDTAFRIVYENILTKCQNGSIDVAEVWNFMNEETRNFPSKLSVTNMIDNWISQGGYPVVTVTRNYKEKSATVSQRKFTYDEPTKDKNTDLWDIPLTYLSVNDDWSNPKKMWLLQNDKEQIIRNISTINNKQNQIDWILVNVNKTGYYRVNYDEKNWQHLSMSLEKNPEDFPTDTRASLVDDVFALAAVGFSKYETAFGFIKYMQMKERHYATWNVLTRHVFKLNNILYESSVLIDFQEFMQKFITPLYNEVGNDISEGSPLTLVAIKLACISEYFKCIDWAKQSFIQLKTNPNFKHTIPMYIRRTLYCTIAKHGGLEEWNYIYQKARSSMKAEEKYNLLSSFGCFQIPGILQSIIDEIIQDDIYNNDEICMILKSFSTNPTASRITYKFITNNWKNITDRYYDNYKVMKSFILAMQNGVTNEQDFMDLHTFWEDNYESIKTIKYAAALVEAKSIFAISLINNYSDDIRKWLKNNNNDSGV